MAIYFYCDCDPLPTGGIRKIYDQVDLLNKHNFEAYVLHDKKDFRVQWFPNETKLKYEESVKIQPNDYIVLPETHIERVRSYPKNKIVIFNQGCYLTFEMITVEKLIKDLLRKEKRTPYYSGMIKGIIVVSKDSKEYVELCFPNLMTYRIYNGIDPGKYAFQPYKKKQIAFLVSKNQSDLVQILSILNLTNVLDGWELVPIHQYPEKKVIQILFEAAIYLNFSTQEGFGLVPAEAIACGCIVAGYDGFGGREYFTKTQCHTVPCGDIKAYVHTLKKLIESLNNEFFSDEIRSQTKKASDYILSTYTMERQETSIVDCWSSITG